MSDVAKAFGHLDPKLDPSAGPHPTTFVLFIEFADDPPRVAVFNTFDEAEAHLDAFEVSVSTHRKTMGWIAHCSEPAFLNATASPSPLTTRVATAAVGAPRSIFTRQEKPRAQRKTKWSLCWSGSRWAIAGSPTASKVMPNRVDMKFPRTPKAGSARGCLTAATA